MFTGEMMDDNGLAYLRARQYNPSLGMFLSRDPIEGMMSQTMSLNQYMYTEGNPINRTDPSGMLSTQDRNQLKKFDVCGGYCTSPQSQATKTSCESFVENLGFHIGNSLSSRGHSWGQTERVAPADSREILLEVLAGYPFGGPRFHKLVDALGQTVYLPDPSQPGPTENFGTQPVPGCEKDPKHCENTYDAVFNNKTDPLGAEIRANYGFKREFFNNSHHFVAYLALATAMGSGYALQHNESREIGTLCEQRLRFCRNHFDDEQWVQILSQRGWQRSTAESITRMNIEDYRWWLMEYSFDMYLTHWAIRDLLAPILSDSGTVDIRNIPPAVRDVMCANTEEGIWSNVDIIGSC